MEKKAKTIAVVGAGGKTTRIHMLAEQYRKAGKKVFVTTTTHMWREPDTVVSCHLADILVQLNKNGYCMAGTPTSDGKIGPLSEDLVRSMEDAADIILVEADGSKGLPVKMPGENEPVIPHDCDEIHVVMGLNALGNTFQKSANRLEIVKRKLSVNENDIIRPWHIQQMIQEGYVVPLRQKYPNAHVNICPAQMQTEYEKRIAMYIEQEKDVRVFVPKVDLILLAAGNSSRFGEANKLLQTIDGHLMFTYALELARTVKDKNKDIVERIIIVSGYEEVETFVLTMPEITFVYNGRPELGISTSIKLGTEATHQEHALLFLVCDQPRLKEETVEGLINEYIRQSSMAGCVKRADGTTGNPCIFSPSLREQLLQLKHDQGGKAILRNLPTEQCCYYIVNEEEELTDIDTREDYESLR